MRRALLLITTLVGACSSAPAYQPVTAENYARQFEAQYGKQPSEMTEKEFETYAANRRKNFVPCDSECQLFVLQHKIIGYVPPAIPSTTVVVTGGDVKYVRPYVGGQGQIIYNGRRISP